ncbi:host specificity protein J [Pseudomonas sp. TWP3-1]|uniref:host specificity protein J n=1 Tax=Pseudomonas sp. TWP3-1 TaxID=2804631 RepID=UPI003CE69588
MGAAQTFGAGGSKGGSEKPHSPVESPDSLINTSYANILDAVSEGPIVGLVNGAQSIFYNQTPLSNSDGSLNFTGVTWEQRTGEAEQEYIRGFPAVESETSVGVELKFSQSWTQAISNSELSAVRVRLGVSTLYTTETDGDTVGYVVQYAIDLSTNNGDYVTVLAQAFDGKTTGGYQRSHRIDLPPSDGGWQIRIRRLTPDAPNSSIQANTSIVSYTEVIDAKLQYPYTALIGTKIDASQFNSIPERAFHIKGRIIQVPANYDPGTRVYMGAWDGTFKLAWTDNPAWIYRDLILNDRYGLGAVISDSQVDKWGLYQIAGYCDELVDDGRGGKESRFTCNLYLQSRANALTVLQDMASIFRGMSYYAGSEVMVSADMPSDPVYTYTNANVIDGKFSRSASSGSTRYSVCKVSWSDRTNFGAAKVEFVQSQKAIARYQIRETETTAFGCVSQGQAQRLGQYILLTNHYETDTVSFSVGMDGTIARPGQLIRVADENYSGKPMSGRIKAATAGSVTLDADIEVEVGDTLVVIRPTGTAEARVIQSVSGRIVTVTERFSSIPTSQSVYTIESAELKAETFRILSVVENFGDDKLQYDIVAVQHNASKFAAIDSGAQIVKLPTTVLPSAVQAIPTNVTLSTFDAVRQGVNVATMRITWTAPKGAASYNVWWRRGSSDWIFGGRVYTASMEVPGIYTGTYTARVAAIGANENSSLWAFSEPTALQGKTGNPPALSYLTATPLIFGIYLKWGFPPGAEDSQRTEIWYGPTTSLEAATKLTDLAYPQSDFSLLGLRAGVTFYFWGRIVDKIGNIGPWYPIGMGVQGQSSSDAAAILEMIAGQIGETELGQDLLDEIQKIPGLQAQIDALDGLKTYDPEATYEEYDLVVVGKRIYQATGPVPRDTPPPNPGYWLDVGQTVQTANGLAQQVATNTAEITELDGVVTAHATAFQALRASSREDDGSGDLSDAMKGWTSTAAIASESKVSASDREATARRLTSFDAKVGENAANITQLEQVVTTANSATATKIGQLGASVGQNTALIQETSTAYADTADKLTTLWSVKMQINAQGQYIAAGVGLGIENTGAGLQSQFLVSADRFAIVNTIAGGAISVPFAVQDGQVFLRSAFIQDGTITNGKIGGALQSTDYIANTQGWMLPRAGAWQMNGTNGAGRLQIANTAIKLYHANGVLGIDISL